MTPEQRRNLFEYQFFVEAVDLIPLLRQLDPVSGFRLDGQIAILVWKSRLAMETFQDLLSRPQYRDIGLLYLSRLAGVSVTGCRCLWMPNGVLAKAAQAFGATLR